MAKQRYIKDSFWVDPYIEKLSPDYKLIFLYLLTNPQCNIAGVYEARPKRIAYETGYDVEVVETILNRFSEDKKIIRINDWIVICNHIKHQSLGNLTAEGINRVIRSTPIEIQALYSEKTLINSKNEEYSVLTLEAPYKPLPNGRKVRLSKVLVSNKNLGIDFNEFWKEYPRKESKSVAQKKWLQLSPEEQEIIIKVLPSHKSQEQWIKDGGKYIPHPSTWLNQRRWEDELQVEQKFKVDKY